MPIDTGMEKISPPVRIFAIVIVLAGAAGMLALRTMGPTVADETSAAPVVKTAAPAPAKSAAAKQAQATPAARKPKPAPAEAAAAAPALNAPASPPTGFPVEIDAALRKHQVLVVSLVVPGARVDQLAAAEAEAGAKLGGVGFLALNVLNEGVARALLTKLDGLQDPSLLVVTRGGTVALQLNGFVDRDTVAQAAANAAS